MSRSLQSCKAFCRVPGGRAPKGVPDLNHGPTRELYLGHLRYLLNVRGLHVAAHGTHEWSVSGIVRPGGEIVIFGVGSTPEDAVIEAYLEAEEMNIVADPSNIQVWELGTE